jgi:hypothetical protein
MPKRKSEAKPEGKPKKHNKSNLTTLSFLAEDEDWLTELYGLLQERIQSGKQLTVIPGSPCLLLQSSKGRLTVKSKDICYGYQLVAWKKFGRETLLSVPPSKDPKSLVISHTCGVRNCCNGDHLLLEPKFRNDERTHCHYLLFHALAKGGFQYAADLRAACPHAPYCWSAVPNCLIKWEVGGCPVADIVAGLAEGLLAYGASGVYELAESQDEL